jgi:PAS domain S-box-containing protein
VGNREPPKESAEELYENAPCGYLSTFPDGTIVRINRTILAWTGYQREDLLTGRRFQDLLTPAGKIYHETHYAPLLRMQGFVNEIAFDLLRADGGRLPVLVNSVEKRDAAGEPLLHRTTVFDATDRRRYERELLLARRKAEEAARAKADLLAMIGHDIRNPLAAIFAGIRLLERTSPTPEQRKYLDVLRATSENLLGLTGNLLDLGRIEAGAVLLDEKGFDPRELVHGIVAGLAARAEEKGLAVRVEVEERVPRRLVGDPGKIGQVLSNLVGNAIKFTEEGSVEVTVRASEVLPDTTVVEFSVRDTGIGIAREHLTRIFEAYAQADHAIGARYGGTGLGLAISRRLVELHGGELVVKSEPGQGSTFSFGLRLRMGRQPG